jgi:hypothetical protein
MNYLPLITVIVIAQLGISHAETKRPAASPSDASNHRSASGTKAGARLGGADIAVAEAGLPVREWTGRTFAILPKQKIVQAFGYELYLTPQLDRCKTPPDSLRETASRRVRCDKFAGSIVVVRDVTASGKEFLVRFSHKPTGTALYGKTRGGTVEGLADAVDFVEAKRRWLGKTVYSLRRFVNIYDSATGNISTRKIRIADPLKVVDVRWGTTPLPPQPLWLIVDAPQAVHGFIPVRISHTNMRADQKTSGKPWEDDILEQDPKLLHAWDAVMWEAIDNHSILPRMTKAQVRMSWGRPKTLRNDSLPASGCEHWIFEDGQDLRFIGDTLVSIDGR